MSDVRVTRRNVLKGISTVAAAAGVGAYAAGSGPAQGADKGGNAESVKPPNILFFLGEGLRCDAFGSAGNPLVQTPVMDRIAGEGVTFKNAFATNALCLPSRGSILTGTWSHTTGAVTNGDNKIPESFPMISDVLREAGYEVAFFGRAHVKGGLMDRYWDYYFGYPEFPSYYNPEIWEGSAGKYGPPKRHHGYVDDVVADKAVEWITTRKSHKPFCLFFWVYAPHEPFYRPRRAADRFNGTLVPKPRNFDEDLSDYAGKSRAVAEANNKMVTSFLFSDDPRSLEEVAKDYFVGVENNDENLGKIIKVIAAKNELDDTAVVVSSDHGFFLGEHTFYDKRLMYEQSIRIPMMIRYPKRIAAGTAREEMVLNVDIAPTIFDIAGVKSPATVQGRSFLPMAEGRAQADWRKDWLYEYFEYPGFENVRPHRGVRNEKYKLMHFMAIAEFSQPEEFELYDLVNDPNEDHNLYGKPGFEVLTAQLKARIEELRRETKDHYRYRPAKMLHLTASWGPPERPVPWRPQRG